MTVLHLKICASTLRVREPLKEEAAEVEPLLASMTASSIQFAKRFITCMSGTVSGAENG